MKKLFYLLTISSILINCIQANDKKEVYKSETLSINRISEHVYEHISYLDTESYGKVSCNGMIISSNNEAVVFDTPTNDTTSLELINWITKTLNNKIIAVIPTHYHEDNLGGLNEFHKHGIPSYAYQKTIQITKEINSPQPQHSFDPLFELKAGNEKVIAEFLGEGHTCDNIIGYFPAENIMFGGCLIKSMGSGKGNLEEANPEDWPGSVKKVKSKYPETKLIIPGHGESGGPELFDYTIKLFE
ncbi:MAG: subclass B1 metallo-beta-lactamase [Tannerella sp.]|jgi:metallo-beta-lactamase class B|nr:subclass B1 metallo-beta-lactamase [Tannerella sp.]